jgi:hypothetical protein
MKLISKNLSIYLNNTYNYNTLLNKWKTSLTNIYSQLRKGFYLSHEFKYIKRQYPKYPFPFKRIKNTKNYNYYKIYNLSSSSNELILSAIPDDLMYIKTKIDKVPNDQYSFDFDYDLQQSYFEYLSNNIPIDCYTIMGDLFSNLKTDKRAIEQYFSFKFLHSLLKKHSNIKQSIASPILIDNYFSQQSIKDEFVYFMNSYTVEDLEVEDESVDINYDYLVTQSGDSLVSIDGSSIVCSLPETDIYGPELSMYKPKNGKYVDVVRDNELLVVKSIKEDRNVIVTDARMYKEVIAEELSLIILRHIYSTYRESNVVLEKLKNSIVQHVLNLPSVFNKYLKSINTDSSLDISDTMHEVYIQLIASQFIKFIQCNQTTDHDKESQIIRHYLNRISGKNLRNYMLVHSLYRTAPDKYLNTLGVNIKEYITNEIMPLKERFITPHDIYTNIQANIFNRQYIENVYGVFLDNFNLTMLRSIWTSNNSSQYVTSTYFGNLFKDFLDSDIFEKWNIDLLTISNKSLLMYGYVNDEYNYYKCLDAIKLYLLVFLRTHLLQNVLFKRLTNKIKSYVQTVTFEHGLDLVTIENEFPMTLETHKDNICDFIRTLYTGSIQKQVLFDLLKFFRL